MTRRFSLLLLLALVAAPVAAWAQMVVRDHREPGAAAQWKIDGSQVDTLSLHTLYNTERRKYLVRSSGNLAWKDRRPSGSADVIFENCTRAGEVVYSSDRIAIRFGTKFLLHGAGGATLDWTDQRERGCEFRLIPSEHGLAPAGSGDGKFAIYNMAANRYLVAGSSLRWQATGSGRPPSAISARADFVAVELVFTLGTFGERKLQTAYLTIQNIGNVPSSASQREMKVRIHGEEKEFLVLNPVAPGATLRNPLALTAFLTHCQHVEVELDTNPRLKFQVGQGAFPNDDVFANDRKIMSARHTGAADAHHGAGPAVGCDPVIR